MRCGCRTVWETGQQVYLLEVCSLIGPFQTLGGKLWTMCGQSLQFAMPVAQVLWVTELRRRHRAIGTACSGYCKSSGQTSTMNEKSACCLRSCWAISARSSHSALLFNKRFKSIESNMDSSELLAWQVELSFKWPFSQDGPVSCFDTFL